MHGIVKTMRATRRGETPRRHSADNFGGSALGRHHTKRHFVIAQYSANVSLFGGVRTI